MKIWGYWATLGWAILAFLAGQFAGLVVLMFWRPDALNALLGVPYDGLLVTLFLLIANPVSIAVIVLAVRLKGASFVDYLALVWPRRSFAALGVGLLVVLIAVSDALLFLSGRALVTPFQIQSYNSAAAEGWLAAMTFATILVAPAGEEIVFRGFMFRGWARSDRSAWPAIIAISALWATMHVQYDWTGILQIFITGLLLGWMRWRSGSTLLTFVLHALFNLEGTIETVLQMRFFS